jgi:hypothetical protein
MAVRANWQWPVKVHSNGSIGDISPRLISVRPTL